MKMDVNNSLNGMTKYTLRTKSLLRRIESERSRQGMFKKKREPKEKQKPPPLSKYRRKTANARERNRMREINEAFETLQKTLPHLPGVDAEKLTKITVLRLAVNYIKILACVKDGDIIGTKDIDELRQLWCLKNAHMARPEHCVRPVFKSNKLNTNNGGNNNSQNKPLKVLNSKPKSSIKNNKLAYKTSDLSKEKSSVNKKKTTKSRSRGKICKTASVATSNGAYITLKNVAFQTTPNRKPYLDNTPLMMSMTVKRPRLEHVSFKKPPKIARYEPPNSSSRIINKQHNQLNFNFNNNNFSTFGKLQNENISPFSLPLSFISTDIAASLKQEITSSLKHDKYLSNFRIYDLHNSPLTVKHETSIKEETGRNNYRLSSVGSLDSAIFSEESLMPESPPKSPSSPPPPPFTPPAGEISPYNSLDALSGSYTSSDSDSVMAPSIELDSLLGSEPFDEELDHLTSSFVDMDDSLSFFLDHASSNFICSDINSC